MGTYVAYTSKLLKNVKHGKPKLHYSLNADGLLDSSITLIDTEFNKEFTRTKLYYIYGQVIAIYCAKFYCDYSSTCE